LHGRDTIHKRLAPDRSDGAKHLLEYYLDRKADNRSDKTRGSQRGLKLRAMRPPRSAPRKVTWAAATLFTLISEANQFRLPAWDAPPSEDGESDLRLLDDLFTHPDPKVAELAKNEKARFLQAIAASKEIRLPIYMERDECGFE
jgi:hypothetical protein